MSVQTHGYIGFTGLSTDTKPSIGVVIGSTFFETDTNKTWTWKYDTVADIWTWVDDGEDIEELLLAISYSDLDALRIAGRLIAGRRYRITDYSTIYQQAYTGIVSISPDGISASLNATTEEIVVMAATTTTFFNNAISISHPTDTILYTFTSQTLTYDTIDYQTKGTITYRKDNIQNIEFDYDFRSLKFRLYKMDIADYDSGATYDYKDMYKMSSNIYMQIGGASNRGCTGMNTAIQFNSGDKYLLLEDKAYGSVSITRLMSAYVDVLSLYNTTTPSDLSIFTNVSARGGINIIYGSASSVTDNVKVYGNGNVLCNGTIPLNTFKLQNVNIDRMSNSILYGCYNTSIRGTVSNIYSNVIAYSDITFGSSSANIMLPSVIRSSVITSFIPKNNSVTVANIINSNIVSWSGGDFVGIVSTSSISVIGGNVTMNANITNSQGITITNSTLPYNTSVVHCNGLYIETVTITDTNLSLTMTGGRLMNLSISKNIYSSLFFRVQNSTIFTKVSFSNCNILSEINSTTTVPSADTTVSDVTVHKSGDTLYYDRLLSSGASQLTYIN